MVEILDKEPRPMDMNRRKLTLVFLVFAAFCSIQAADLQVVAHRGANHLAPENTMAAAQKCVDLGVDYVEIDVRMSKDRVFYILHDRTLDRTTDGTGAIKDRSSAYVDALDAGSWFGAEFKDEKVPQLESYLKTFKGKIKIYFDVKDADLRRLLDLVYETGFEKDCFFWFSRDSRAEEFRKLDQTLWLKMNAGNEESLEKAMAYRPQIIECGLGQLTPAFVGLCRERNLKLMAIALGKRSEAQYPEIINSPADMVNLDKADVMMRLISRSSRSVSQ